MTLDAENNEGQNQLEVIKIIYNKKIPKSDSGELQL
jgi:hypothetical protein